MSFLKTSTSLLVMCCSVLSTARRSVKVLGTGLHLAKKVRDGSDTGISADSAEIPAMIGVCCVRYFAA